MTMKAAVIAWICIAIMDTVLTWHYLPAYRYEANPIPRWFMLQMGDWAYLLFLAAIVPVAWLLWRFRTKLIAQVVLILMLLFQSQCVWSWVIHYVW